MIVSILIVADFKEKFIFKTIKSCLNQSYKKIEILIGYSHLNKSIIKKILSYKKIKLFKIKKRFIYPTQDQIYKIRYLFNRSKGKYIFLLDGDDIFLKDKIKQVYFFLKKENDVLIYDKFFIKKNSKIYLLNEKKYKKNFFFKFLFNDWPQNIATSALSITKRGFKNFFRETNPFAWKYLAIDILLVIFFQKKRKIKYLNKILTIKNEGNENLDTKFKGFFNKKYWFRRLEQHDYNYTFKKLKSIEHYICIMVVFFINHFIDNNKS